MGNRVVVTMDQCYTICDFSVHLIQSIWNKGENYSNSFYLLLLIYIQMGQHFSDCSSFPACVHVFQFLAVQESSCQIKLNIKVVLLQNYSCIRKSFILRAYKTFSCVFHLHQTFVSCF